MEDILPTHSEDENDVSEGVNEKKIQSNAEATEDRPKLTTSEEVKESIVEGRENIQEANEKKQEIKEPEDVAIDQRESLSRRSDKRRSVSSIMMAIAEEKSDEENDEKETSKAAIITDVKKKEGDIYESDNVKETIKLSDKIDKSNTGGGTNVDLEEAASKNGEKKIDSLTPTVENVNNLDTLSEGGRSVVLLSRATTNDSELFQNDNDFPTPDYDQYLKDESVLGSEPDKSVVEGKERHLMSRESTKSVTFADDVQLSDVKKEQEAIDRTAAQLFRTAVSDEKIKEAKMKQIDHAKSQVNTEALATDLFGGSKYIPIGIDDVIHHKADEHFERGRQLAAMREHRRAIICFDKALNLDTKNVVYYTHRAEAYLQLCDFQSAILNLKKACVLDPDNDSYYTKLAFMYYFQGQTLFDQCLFPEALEAFSRASEMRPEVIAYHTRTVACLAALQRHGECLALVNKRLEVEQDNSDLYIMRARLHQLFRNTTLCYYDLKDALNLDPYQEEARTLMKQLEAKAEEYRSSCIQQQLQGRYKDALQKITSAIANNPTVPEYHILRGALHRKLLDFNASIDDYLLAMDKSGHDEQDTIYMDAQRQLLLTYNDFAVECFVRGHFNEAVMLLNKAIKGEKREKGLYINRGDCFFRLGELHFSLADYHQALELDNLDWNVHSRIARVHFEFGQLDYEEQNYHEAEARFTLAMQHNPKVGSYYVYRAKVRFTLENQAGSRQDLLVALHLDPNHQDILALLPRLFPGKNISDVIKSKAARNAKQALDNAMITAAPVKLPAIHTATNEDSNTEKNAVYPTTPPVLKLCMDEIEFNRELAQNKKRVSNNVKKIFHDRKSLRYTGSKLVPQPPAQPVETRGGHWKQDMSVSITGGWRSFSHGVGIRDAPT
ncbi:tetratricopeptide repeat protein 16-like [Anneissia japonica]|uniref:tetratricopeptide repeat protein 16-like n=1 Tax=Anneissia japonica TaxID=1529436 RepID=UPI001425969A|nr:tetratricopeptide repeat protein 16-like [Anneissia japonica]